MLMRKNKIDKSLQTDTFYAGEYTNFKSYRITLINI